MNNRNLSSHAWLLHGLTGSTAGVLSLRDERIRFVSDEGQLVFDAARGEVRDIGFPWPLFGGGFAFSIGGEKIPRFVGASRQHGGRRGRLGAVAQGRAQCQRWKTAFAS